MMMIMVMVMMVVMVVMMIVMNYCFVTKTDVLELDKTFIELKFFCIW